MTRYKTTSVCMTHHRVEQLRHCLFKPLVKLDSHEISRDGWFIPVVPDDVVVRVLHPGRMTGLDDGSIQLFQMVSFVSWFQDALVKQITTG